MKYKFYKNEYETIFLIERHSHLEISYISKKMMHKLHPNMEYEVIGEINNFKKRFSAQDLILMEDGKNIPIFPCGSYKKPLEWVAGYKTVDENVYVAVLKSLIPNF